MGREQSRPWGEVHRARVMEKIKASSIAERGNHAELMRAGGLYARMFEMQAGPYLA